MSCSSKRNSDIGSCSNTLVSSTWSFAHGGGRRSSRRLRGFDKLKGGGRSRRAQDRGHVLARVARGGRLGGGFDRGLGGFGLRCEVHIGQHVSTFGGRLGQGHGAVRGESSQTKRPHRAVCGLEGGDQAGVRRARGGSAGRQGTELQKAQGH